MTKEDGDIVLNPHTTGACVLILDEAEATAMRDALSERRRRRPPGLCPLTSLLCGEEYELAVGVALAEEGVGLGGFGEGVSLGGKQGQLAGGSQWEKLAVATTFASAASDSCTASRPTPPEPPWTRTVSPELTLAAATACTAVAPTSKQARCLLPGQFSGLRYNHLGRNREGGGVAALGRIGDDLISDRQRTRRSDRIEPYLGDHSGYLESQAHRKVVRGAAQGTAVELVVDRVDPGGANLDRHLSRPGRGHLGYRPASAPPAGPAPVSRSLNATVPPPGSRRTGGPRTRRRRRLGCPAARCVCPSPRCGPGRAR